MMKFKLPKFSLPRFHFPRLSIKGGLISLGLTMGLVGAFFLFSPKPPKHFEAPLELPLTTKPPAQADPLPQEHPLPIVPQGHAQQDKGNRTALEQTHAEMASPEPKEAMPAEEAIASRADPNPPADTAAPQPETNSKAETDVKDPGDSPQDTPGSPPQKSPPHDTLAADQPNNQGSATTGVALAPTPLLPLSQPDGPHFYNACLERYQNTGWLPKISSTGVRPFDIYQNTPSFDIAKTPLSIIVRELGQSEEIFHYLQTNFPPQISYAFFPRGQFSEQQNKIARARGIETWLHIPFEPLMYPDHDPGFETLLTGVEAAENLRRLHNHLSQLTGYIGIMPYMGSRFGRVKKDFKPILQDIAARGLAYIEAKGMRSKAYEWSPQPNWLNATATLDIPRGLSQSQLQEMFTQVAAQLEKGNPMILSIEPDLFALQQLQGWLQQLDPEKIALIPLSHQIQGR
jgi:polysaccharide deacetylase 2 family uncharacterized protein YibQ